jgi:ABC-type cobalt transport system substrate-binding protein
MSKRNFILLIIILAIAIIAFFGFLYFQQSTTSPGGDNTGTNFISQFNPFGNKKPATPPTTTPPIDISGDETPTTEEVIVKLKKISSMPIAGFTVFSKERLKDVPVVTSTVSLVNPTTIPTTTIKKTTKPAPPLTEFMPALRYVERATGNIYQTFADKIEERKFSTTIIPMVYEAFFGNNGESVIMRYLKADAKTIVTFVSTLPKEFLGADTTDSNEIKGTFLPENTKDVSLSGDAKSLFYLFSSGSNGDSIIGTTLTFLNNKKIQVFDSPFTEWLSQFPNSKMIAFTTKPASLIPGYMYSLDPNNKNYNFHQVLGNINGLTTLTSPNGKLVLYSDDSLALKVYHTDTKVSDVLGLKTLAEKCVWNKINDSVYCGVPKSIPSGQYPDDWYQGEVSFGDQIWKIDIKTGNATMIADPNMASGEDIDSIKLMLDNGENYLFFINKKDSFLWELELK